MNPVSSTSSSIQEEEYDPLPCYITAPAAVIYVSYQFAKQGLKGCWRGLKNGFFEVHSSFESGFIEGRKFSHLSSQIATEMAFLTWEGISLIGKESAEHVTSGAKASWIFSTYFVETMEKGVDPILHLTYRGKNEVEGSMRSGCSESLKGIMSFQKQTKEASSLLFPLLLIAIQEIASCPPDGGREIVKGSLYGYKLASEAVVPLVNFPVDCVEDLLSYIPPGADQLRQYCFSIANVVLEFASREIVKTILLELVSYFKLSEQETIKIYFYIESGLKQSELLFADLLFELLLEAKEQMIISGKEGGALAHNTAKGMKRAALFFERDFKNVAGESHSYLSSGLKESNKGMELAPKAMEVALHSPIELLQLSSLEIASYFGSGSVQAKEFLKATSAFSRGVSSLLVEDVRNVIIESSFYCCSGAEETYQGMLQLPKVAEATAFYPKELLQLLFFETISYLGSGSIEAKGALNKSIEWGKIAGEGTWEGIVPMAAELVDFLHSSTVVPAKEGVRFLQKESATLYYPCELIELMLVETLSHLNSGSCEGVKLKKALLKTDVPNVADSLIVFPLQEWWHKIEPEIQAWLDLYFHDVAELIQNWQTNAD